MQHTQTQSTAPTMIDFALQHASASDRVHPIPDSSLLMHERRNAQILNATLQKLRPNQTLVISQKYHLLGGVVAYNLTNVTILLDGQLIFSRRTRHWPRSAASADTNTEGDGRKVFECIHLIDPVNVTLTSSHRSPRGGILNGQGSAWWGLPLIGYVRYNEDRPRLIRITRGTNIVLENWFLLDSPYWSTLFEEMNGLIIRYVGVQARRTNWDGHTLLDLSAFNTDGIDVTGTNIHVHDCNIWTQDDVIAVKDGPRVIDDENDYVGGVGDGTDANRGMMRRSSNMIFERINATGLGLTIGSIGNFSEVRNITFRDCYLHKTVKGIYTKFRKSNMTRIEDVTFENIIMDAPSQFAIWIGPAQQADSVNFCHANPCSLCWPIVPGSKCSGEVNGTYRNLLLKNIQINRPRKGGGVLMASADNKMRGVIFDGVRVGCGPLHHNGNVADAFPLLPNEDVFDLHVVIFQLMCVGGLLIVGYIFWKISRMAWIQTRFREKAPRGLALLGILLSFGTVHIAYISLAMGKAENYFVCEGVHGEAIGDTFPVPSCLDDHTNVDARGKESSCSTPFWQEPVGGAAIAAFVTVLVCIAPALVPLLIRYMNHQKSQSNQSSDLTDEEAKALNTGRRNKSSSPEDYREEWAEHEPDTGVAMVSLRGKERQNT